MAKKPSAGAQRKVTPDTLQSLGAAKLAEILAGVAETRPDLKRRLRMELAAEQGPSALAPEIDKRLTAFEKSRGKVTWRQKPAVRRPGFGGFTTLSLGLRPALTVRAGAWGRRGRSPGVTRWTRPIRPRSCASGPAARASRRRPRPLRETPWRWRRALRSSSPRTRLRHRLQRAVRR